MRKKIVSLILLSLVLSFSIQSIAFADAIRIHNKPWNYILIENKETVEVDTIIFYFLGSGNNGTSLGDLSILMGEKAPDGPAKYATTTHKTNWPPVGTIIVCPQDRDDRDFYKNIDSVLSLMEEYTRRYPKAKVILTGHSNGAIMLFTFATTYGTDMADGWVFISGRSPKGDQLPSYMRNVMVVVGTKEDVRRVGINTRNDFKNLYNVELGTEVTKWREEYSNNAYVVGDWTHGQTPRIFLEDFFWDWIKDV